MTEPDRRAQQIAAAIEVMGWQPGAVDDYGNDIDALAGRIVDAVEAAPRTPADQVGACAVLPLDAVRALWEVYRTWMYDIGTLEPPRDLIDTGIASLLTIEDAHAMDAVGDAVEPHEAEIRTALEAPTDAIAQAEARGWAAAVKALRDERRFDAWWHAHGGAIETAAADYLESVAPGRPGAPDGATPTDDQGE